MTPTPNAAAAAQQYRKLDTQGAIENASPHRLIQLMMERVLTKIGMTREGLLRDDLLVDGGWRDSVIYAALADEWPDKGVYL